jgi:hypothetical protein
VPVRIHKLRLKIIYLVLSYFFISMYVYCMDVRKYESMYTCAMYVKRLNELRAVLLEADVTFSHLTLEQRSIEHSNQCSER